jgi:hypothetical protein
MNDPIVEEVHAARQRISDECGGDVERLIAWLKTLDSNPGRRITTIEEVEKWTHEVNGKIPA